MPIFVTNLKGSLKQHQEAIREGVRYKCDLCEKQFTQKGDVKVYKQSFHNGQKFPCNLWEFT